MGKASVEPAPGKQRQWVTNQDGLDKLKLQEVDTPVVKDGEVLVRIKAVSLNYRDTEGEHCCPWIWPWIKSTRATSKLRRCILSVQPG